MSQFLLNLFLIYIATLWRLQQFYFKGFIRKLEYIDMTKKKKKNSISVFLIENSSIVLAKE